MKIVVFSKKDVASQNIKNVLISMLSPDERRVGEYTVYNFGNFVGVEIEERLIYADGLDEKLEKFLNFDEIIFASRHSSQDQRKILTAHFTGNLERADFGGKPYSLAKPSPNTLKNYWLSVKDSVPEGYEFSLEATHHGPSEIKKRSVFVEIGSTDEECLLIISTFLVIINCFCLINNLQARLILFFHYFLIYLNALMHYLCFV